MVRPHVSQPHNAESHYLLICHAYSPLPFAMLAMLAVHSVHAVLNAIYTRERLDLLCRANPARAGDAYAN
jgi:hypothetical protein